MSDVVEMAWVAGLAPSSLLRIGFLIAVLVTVIGRRGHVITRPLPLEARRSARPSDRTNCECAVEWDQAAWDALASRLSALTCAFLAAVVPRAGRAARADTTAPATQSFMDALEHAMGLLVTSSLDDSPAALAAAVEDAERHWKQVVGEHLV